MKKYLLPEKGQFYKANLHSHSTCSDGVLTPEEMRDAYKEKGYNILCITDHELFIPYNYLTTDNFLMLNGAEIGINDTKVINGTVKTHHMGMIALDPDIEVDPLWDPDEHFTFANIEENREKVKFNSDKPYKKVYSAEGINDMIKTAREAGFFVIFNHPYWSLEDFRQYIQYEGMHALEIYNHGSQVYSDCGYNPQVYDELLAEGRRIGCVAADDNHNYGDVNSPKYDAFGGFTMIKAEKLDYQSVTEALLRGNYYASTGPEIKALWIDTDTNLLHVECSDAVKVSFMTGDRRFTCEYPYEQGKEYLNEATFRLSNADKFDPDSNMSRYVRVNVYDKNGKVAHSRAYFMDEL